MLVQIFALLSLIGLFVTPVLINIPGAAHIRMI